MWNGIKQATIKRTNDLPKTAELTNLTSTIIPTPKNILEVLSDIVVSPNLLVMDGYVVVPANNTSPMGFSMDNI